MDISELSSKTNNMINEDYFVENDSQKIIQNLNESIAIINMQSKNICRIIKNQKTVGTGFLCNVPNKTFTNLFPVLITSNNISIYYDFIKDKQIILQFNNEDEKVLILNNERKIYISEEYDILFIEIKPNDGFDINYFLEIDDLLYKKNEEDINIKEKDIYLIHYPKNKSKIITFTTMNKISVDKYIIKNLKSINKCSIGCPIFNYSNFKIIGVYNIYNNEIKLNSKNDLMISINEYINEINKKNEIIISLYNNYGYDDYDIFIDGYNNDDIDNKFNRRLYFLENDNVRKKKY